MTTLPADLLGHHDNRDRSWMVDAACRGMDTSLFYAERGADVSEARSVCAGCPVAAQCEDYGLTEHFGTWGGKSGKQRRAIRRERREPTHGTLDGYDWHKRTGSDPCGPCRRANATRYYPQAVSA